MTRLSEASLCTALLPVFSDAKKRQGQPTLRAAKTLLPVLVRLRPVSSRHWKGRGPSSCSSTVKSAPVASSFPT